MPLKIKMQGMDTLHVNCLTPEVRRLITFQLTPLANDRKLSLSNSPAKFARAGFQRGSDARNDEVVCSFCKITYGDWEGESPFAVHRVLNEHCPFLSTSSLEDVVQRHPTVVDARRRLFPTNDETVESEDQVDDSGYDSRLEECTQSPASSYISVLSPEASFSFPFHPRVGDASMLFASRRLKTFTDPRCKLCAKWAEEGFVYRPDMSDVQCVYCEVVFPFDSFEVRELHSDSSPYCPQVLMKDVGNITRADEERIKFKKLKWQLKQKEPVRSYAICHPQYEEESVRVGTFENWPLTEWADRLHPQGLSEAGFYFTGCADKVQCYCCGVGLLKWRQGAQPWEQHALHMPSCPHLQARGHNFIQQAAHAQVLTEADLPMNRNGKDSSGSTGHLVTSPPGSLTMNVSAVTAALTTSQYSEADVRQAVLTYFCHTSRFPTKDILLGQLRAADVNFTDLCKQRDLNYRQSTVIQEKDTALQEKDTALQEKDTALQEKDTALQEQSTVIQEKDTVIQEQGTLVEQHVQALQQRDEELQFHREAFEAELEQKEAELEQKEAELERRRRLLAYQERQISALQHQMQALLAHRRQADQQQALHLDPVQAAANNAAAPNAAAVENSSMTCDVRCKVCLSAESNTIFQPCCHITCCKTCAQQLVSEVCPVCRTPISDVLPAYIA